MAAGMPRIAPRSKPSLLAFTSAAPGTNVNTKTGTRLLIANPSANRSRWISMIPRRATSRVRILSDARLLLGCRNFTAEKPAIFSAAGSLKRPRPIRLRGVVGIERARYATRWNSRSLRYNSAEPERFKAGIRWNPSALKFSKIFAARPRSPRAQDSGCALAERTWRQRIASEILAVLAGDADEMVSERAQQAILSQPTETFVEAAETRKKPFLRFLPTPENISPTGPAFATPWCRIKIAPRNTWFPPRGIFPPLGITALMEEVRARERVPRAGALRSSILHPSPRTKKHQLHELLRLRHG